MPHPPESPLAAAVRELCLEGHSPPPPDLRDQLPSKPAWQALRDTGTTIWLDTGDVEAIRSVWSREMVALTTNNTLLNKEVQKGLYDDLVPRAAIVIREAAPGISRQELVQEIAFVLNATHGLGLVRTFDADVSVELHTDFARDSDASHAYGMRFHAICPDRFIVKVPLTPQGLVAARRLHDDGVRVNFTLGFSARQNLLIARVARPDWVNVFMGRIGSFIDEAGLGSGAMAGEKATLASQRMLREHGFATKQIGASIRSGEQCRDLAGVDVLTVPIAAAREFEGLGVRPGELTDRTDSDPQPDVADHVDLAAHAIDRFWVIEDELRAAADALAEMPVERLDGPTVLAVLADHDFAGLFPDLDDTEHRALIDGGKIPDHATWRETVAQGNASWDGLLSEAALASFAQDQRALDQRIARLL